MTKHSQRWKEDPEDVCNNTQYTVSIGVSGHFSGLKNFTLIQKSI